VLAELSGDESILLAQRNDPLMKPYDGRMPDFWPDAKEAFLLRRIDSRTIIATGFDASGTLYAALDLADRVAENHALPALLDFEDHPQLRIRGYALGMQKPEITYEGAEYDYLYTPKDFPFFYDKSYWTRYLDYLLKNRVNALFLWSGHPFTSLLKLPKYPEAHELPTEQLEQNIAMFHWLTEEADKRGIWILQGFYNIHLSHAFARAHGVPYHLSAPTPLASDYTRYAISEFIRNYPSVGIFMTLGEAMGPHYGPEWLTKTIIPGVKDGVAELSAEAGRSVAEPPIVVRAHATDIEDVMAASKPLYSNIDTMWKWNGESLTWTNIRGPVRQRFDKLVAGSNTTIANIHLLSNLEPFRWGDPDFIRQTLLNFERIGITGLHLYPLRYWDWPVAADSSTPLLEQTERDWIWYDAWARYAWNPNRDPAKEREYWVSRFADRYGTSEAGEQLLSAYEAAGVCAPRLLPRIGITEGNRQVLALGMTMPQLIDAARFNPAETLWTGDAPDGERLDEYVANQLQGKPHHGENPLGVTEAVVESSAKAVAAAEAAEAGVTRNREEYERVVNDMRAIHQLMLFYRAKTQAAYETLLFGYDHNAKHLSAVDSYLAQSVDAFRELSRIADPAYRTVAGMQTSQRQIPVRGSAETNHWRDLVPVYEKELAVFRDRMKSFKQGAFVETGSKSAGPLPQVPFTLEPGAGETFAVGPGHALYSDNSAATITTVAPELNGLTGIRVSTKQSEPLHFTLGAPAQILVGFFKSSSNKALNVSPAAEQWNQVLPNAITASKMQPISAWAKPLPAGKNDLDLGKGAYVVLGFIPEEARITPHVTFTTANGNDKAPNLDWLFED
jgi:hypothetical protein